MQRSDVTTANPGVASPATPLAMTGIWRTIRDYILWSYERGTIQYDVMVTLILFFVFLSPHWINFKDRPVEVNPHRTEVVVEADGNDGGLIFQIDGSVVPGNDDSEVRAELLRTIEPISGNVSIKKYAADRDRSGKVRSYRVWVQRQ